MTRLLVAIFLACSLGTTSIAAHGQAAKVPRVGVLYLGVASKSEGPTSGLAQGLHDLGYVDGRNVVIEWRYAGGDPARLAVLAAELVAAKVDVIVAGGPGPLAAARRATSRVPIVAVSGGDPVAEGWAANLARPGGNVTGLLVTFPELAQKRLELLKELLPGMSRVAVVIAPFEFLGEGAATIADMEAAAVHFGMQLQILRVRNVADVERVAAAASAGRAQAIFTVETTFIVGNRSRIAALAAREGIPVAGEFTAFGVDDILLAYGADLGDLLRRAATHVDRILKGERPADMPIERPVKLELTLNTKVARALKITIPTSLRLRADRVVE